MSDANQDDHPVHGMPSLDKIKIAALHTFTAFLDTDDQGLALTMAVLAGLLWARRARPFLAWKTPKSPWRALTC
jgi:hypothetical protein